MAYSRDSEKARRDAELAGLKYYISGKPCRNGHTGPRFVSNYSCLECNRELQRAIYAAAKAFRNGPTDAAKA